MLKVKQFVVEHLWYCTVVNQVILLLALIYGLFEVIRRKTHCNGPLNKPLVKGQKVIAIEVFKSDII